MSNPQSLGRKVASAQERLFDEERAVSGAEALLFGESGIAFKSNRNRSRRGYLYAMGAAAAVALLLFGAIVAYMYGSPAPLTVRINGKRTEVPISYWIPSEKNVDTAIDFSDGSRVRLDATARARFIKISSHGAEMLVEQGYLFADIAKNDGARWRFFAGPYEVIVTGTRFGLRWDHLEKHFTIRMDEGSVRIEGPAMTESQTLTAGKTLDAWVDLNRMKIASNMMVEANEADILFDTQRTLDVAPGVQSEMPLEHEDGENGLSKSDNASNGRESGRKEDGTRCEPVRKDRIRSVQSAPFLRVDCPASDAVSALDSADSMRRAGAIARSVSAYRRIRRCYKGSPEAALAAFTLGKIAFDNRRDWSKAALWFEKYLAEEQGRGPAREALGRLMESFVKGHRQRRAREIAEQYLAKYPAGPHSSFAKSLLEEGADSIPVHE